MILNHIEYHHIIIFASLNREQMKKWWRGSFLTHAKCFSLFSILCLFSFIIFNI